MSRARLALPYVLLVALALRLVAAVVVERVVGAVPGREFLIPGDADGYWELGQRMTKGEDFAIHDPPRYALRMPGFPLVLAIGMTLTGGSRFGTRCWLAVVGTFACGLVFWLGRELFDDAVAIVATSVVAIAPTLVGFGVLVLSETAFATAMLGSLVAFAILLRPVDAVPVGAVPVDRRGLALVVGLLVAVAVYVRPAWILALPVFVVIDVVRATDRRAALLRGGLMVAGLAAALAPWTIRNAFVTGHFVPTTLWLGPTLYDGLHQGADGGSDMRFFETDRRAGLTRGMGEYEVDRFYRHRAVDFAFANPIRVISLAVAKQARFWSPVPNAEQFRRPLGYAAVLVFFVPMIVLGLRGWWLARGDSRAWLLTVGPLLYFAALHLVFVGSIRYRLPVEYPFWIVAAVGLVGWLPGWRRWLVEEPGVGPQPAFER